MGLSKGLYAQHVTRDQSGRFEPARTRRVVGVPRMAAEDCGNLTTPKWLNCLRTERPSPLRSQYFSQEAARRRSLVAGELFGRPLPNHPPAADAPLGAEIDHVIGRLDHVEIVLDDDDRVALVDQLLEHVEQLPGVLEVQP